MCKLLLSAFSYGLRRLIVVGLVTASLLSCAKPLTGVPIEEEDKLFTSGMFRSLQQYHVVLDGPSIQQLEHPGFIVGVEKSPRGSVSFPSSSESEVEQYDTSRLRFPSERMTGVSAEDVERQETRFEKILDDFKVMYVSHLVEYGVDVRGNPSAPELLFSAYQTTGFETRSDHCSLAVAAGVYEQGWHALECLKDRVFETIEKAERTGSPYTHVVLIALGWNTSQEKAIDQYNRIIRNTKIAAGQNAAAFEPLTIGITWPSVWGGSPDTALLNLPLHLVSYSARANDADELGLGIVNELLNGLSADVESAFELPTIAIGHSFGARALSRALYSSDFRTSHSEPASIAGPLVIGLQPAFSANRFQADEPPRFPFNMLRVPAEGGPYQEPSRASGRLVLTWSDNDAANRSAQFVTGARHVGGRPGYELSRTISGPPGSAERFIFLKYPFQKEIEDCNSMLSSDFTPYIDATSVIDAHGDIGNLDDGRLIWDVIRCSGFG